VHEALRHETRGIYPIPLLGTAAVAEDNFPSRRPEATIALAGPLTGAMLAAGTGLAYFATRNGAFAAAAAWMALINLFNLLPVVPLDGGRVVKPITCSIGSRTGLAALIAGMLLGAVLHSPQICGSSSSSSRWDCPTTCMTATRRTGQGGEIGVAGGEACAHRDRGRHPRCQAAAQPARIPRCFRLHAGLAILLWLFMLAMGHQAGAAAAMHALQG
jgi:Zn-dependent protease